MVRIDHIDGKPTGQEVELPTKVDWSNRDAKEALEARTKDRELRKVESTING